MVIDEIISNDPETGYKRKVSVDSVSDRKSLFYVLYIVTRYNDDWTLVDQRKYPPYTIEGLYDNLTPVDEEGNVLKDENGNYLSLDESPTFMNQYDYLSLKLETIPVPTLIRQTIQLYDSLGYFD